MDEEELAEAAKSKRANAPEVKPLERVEPIVEVPTPTPSAPTAPKSSLEAAVAGIESTRTLLRTAIMQLGSTLDALKALQREQRVSEREMQSVRATLRALQNVKI